MDKTGRICPGKREDKCESREFSRSPIGCDLDSTFDFESTSSEDDWIEDNYSNGNDDMFESVDTVSLHNENSFSELDTDDTVSSYDASSDGDVWEDVELSDEFDEDIDAVERNGLVSQVVLGIAFFLTYFHLLYHLSEVAIRTLLTFTRQLIHFLAIITHHDLLLQIMNCIPKSMNTIRNKFKETAFVEYVVCPKCNKLYLLDDCTVNINGHLESRNCTYVEFPNHQLISKRRTCGEMLLKSVKLGKKMKFVGRKT